MAPNGHYIAFKSKETNEYKNSSERFDEANQLHKKDFYSSLKDEHISDKDYQEAMKVWNEFEMENMVDYHDLSLKTF